MVQEVNDLNARLAELENKEKALLAQVQSETAEGSTLLIFVQACRIINPFTNISFTHTS